MSNAIEEKLGGSGDKFSTKQRIRFNYVNQRLDILLAELESLRLEKEELNKTLATATDNDKRISLRKRAHYILHRVPEIRERIVLLRDEKKGLLLIVK